MRLFFALETPPELARGIADWRDRHLPASGRPVPPANFHITLAFIGEVSEYRLERLCLETDDLLHRHCHRPGALSLDELGYWHKPGIYWLGPTQWPRQLEQLATQLQSRGIAAGGKRKRASYRPHITLYRGCTQPPPAPALPPDFHLAYDGFALMESRSGRRGVSYHEVAQWQLHP